jgi:hypothetical protein
MSEPQPPPVPLKLWREVLEGALALRRLEPWKWMHDCDQAVFIDDAGTPWFASILGAAKEMYGLALYRGDTGWRLVQRLLASDESTDMAELGHEQDSLTLWFGGKSDLDEHQRARWQELGYAPRRGERHAWPDIRRHRPGWFPWPPDESEARVLAVALPAIRRFCEFLRDNPDAFDGRGPVELPVVPTTDVPLTPESLEWRHWSAPAPAPQLVRLTDEVLLARLGALPQAADFELEVDWFYAGEPVADGGRPYFPRAIVIMRGDGGYCQSMDLVPPSDVIGQRLADALVKAVLQLGARPERVAVRRAELAVAFAPLADQIGCDVRQAPRLRYVEELRAGLRDFTRGR